MSDINEKDNEILGKDLSSHDADDIEALAESMADSDSSVSAEEKKSNRKKLKEQLLIEAGLGKSIIDKNNYQNNFKCIIIIKKDILEKDYHTLEKEINEYFLKCAILEEKK